MLRSDRTSFDKGFRKIAVVVPNAHPAYAELCQKYGGDNVFRATTASAEVAFVSAQNVLQTNSNDAVYLYPGTLTLSASVAVSKNVTFCGPNDNQNSVVVDADTSAVVGFTLAATADYAVFKNFTVTKDAANAAFSIPSTCPGVIIDNVTEVGAGTSTLATDVGIACSAANLVVKNCKFTGINRGIRNTGATPLFVGNYFQCAAAGTPVGIDQTTGDYPVVDGNTFHYATTSAICIRTGSDASVTGPSIYNNRGNTGTTQIHDVASTVPAIYNNNRTSTLGVTSVMTYVAG